MYCRQKSGGPMTPLIWFVGFLLVLVGSACTSVAPMPGVSDVYFTNAQSGPGYQLYNAGSPYQILPPVGAFDRERDTRITIVIIFSTGSAHALRAVLNAPSGGTPRPVSWAAP